MAGLCKNVEELGGVVENISELRTGDHWWRHQCRNSEGDTNENSN